MGKQQTSHALHLRVALVCLLVIGGPSAWALNEAAQTFTLDGQLFQAGSTHSLLDSSAKLKVQIIDPAGACLLYEEEQTVDTSTTDGRFTVYVGSGTGSAKRTVNDPGRTMAQIFQNSVPISANSVPGQTCAGGAYSPLAGAVRYFRITVTPSSTGIANVLTPDMALNSVPQAIVAQSVQGIERSQILQVNNSGPTVLTQSNLEALFTTPAYTNLQAILGGNFIKTDSSGASLPSYAATPAGASNGDIWFDTTTNQIKYQTSGGVQTVGAAGGGSISSLTVGSSMSLNGSIAGTISNGAGTIDLANTGITAGTYTKLVIDAKGRATSGTVSLVEGDIPTLTTAGKVSGNAITSGTISGSAAINTSGNLVTSGTVSALTVQATNLRVYNGANFMDAILNGGNSTAGTISIGTNDNNALSFKANNAIAMTISQSGNVGIGTSVPSGIFEVAGGTAAANANGTNITLTAQAPGTGNQNGGNIVLTPGGKTGTGAYGGVLIGYTTQPAWLLPNSLYLAGAVYSGGGYQMNNNYTMNWGTGSTKLLGSGSTNATDYLAISTNAVERLRIDGSGNIGIGISVPTSALSISGATTYTGIAAPAVSPAGTGRLYYDTTANKFKVSENGGSYTNLVGVGGTGTTNAIPKFTAAGTIGDSAITDNGTVVTATRAVISTTNPIATGAAVNLATSNTHTLASVGGSAITISGQQDGGMYTVVVEDTTSRTYTFTGCTNSYFKPVNAPTTVNTRTVYGLMTIKKGANWDCYITWSSGFQ